MDIVEETASSAGSSCPKCRGTLFYQQAVDSMAGLWIPTLSCLNCGRRHWFSTEPQPLTMS